MAAAKTDTGKVDYRLLLLLFFILCFPFVMHYAEIQTGLGDYPWFPAQMEIRADFFLLYKSKFLTICAGIMLIVLLDDYFIKGRRGASIKKWIPLFAYELLAVISACASHYKTYSLHGMMEHFETIWVLLGYGILAYYAYSVIRDERDFQIIMAVLTVLYCVQVLIGLFQLAGLDLLQTETAGKLLLSGSGVPPEQLLFNFSREEYQRVYGTFYNPNYAGIYYTMMLPVVFAYLHGLQKKGRILMLFLMAAGVLCIIGTGSKSAAATLMALIVIWGVSESIYNRRKVWGMCFVFLFVLSLFFCYDKVSGNGALKRFVEGFSPSGHDSALQKITVEDTHVNMLFHDRDISFFYEENGAALSPVFLDADGNAMAYTSDEQTQTCTLLGKEFAGLTFQCYRKNQIPYIVMEYNGIKWRFTDYTESGSYQYITVWGKPDSIEQAKSVLFTGKEELFTNRGYIWGRTIPLLKNYLFLGSGPDSFLLVFPQNDYVARANLGYGFFTEILTKPHSMYLQIALQTGVLSAVCYFMLLIGYVVEGFGMYCGKCRKKGGSCHLSADLGLYLLLAVSAYALMGITNDSMLVSAPYFWILLGMGMKWNHLWKSENSG